MMTYDSKMSVIVNNHEAIILMSSNVGQKSFSAFSVQLTIAVLID